MNPSSVTGLLRDVDRLRWQLPVNVRDQWVEQVYAEAARLADRHVTRGDGSRRETLQRRMDRLLTGRWTGVPIMILVLAAVLWITIVGANVPSGLLASLLIEHGHGWLKAAASSVGLPWWLDGLLIDGIYLTVAWVVSVMLPPMAIFFPLFTILEDFGYLPRVAFNLDRLFQRSGAHGKQALTMCMGLGCNAAGITATRIIDSPRERLIAIVTNNFALCNGRWPTQILIATVFLGSLAPPALAGLVASSAVLGVALLGVGLTFAVSWGLSRTLLRGEASVFSLELPPYRPPNIWRTCYTSLIDRTLFVLWRAVVFAVPAGAAIWLIANIPFGSGSLAEALIGALQPLGWALGLNGVILLAYVVAIPANEIVIPTVLMLTVLTTGAAGFGDSGAGVMFEVQGEPLRLLLEAGGWTLLTAVSLMLFSLCHNPCSTTLYTIYKETHSRRWTVVSAFLPLAIGVVLCGTLALLWRLAV